MFVTFRANPIDDSKLHENQPKYVHVGAICVNIKYNLLFWLISATDLFCLEVKP